MCEPTTLMLLGTAGAVGGAVQQGQNQRRTLRYQNHITELTESSSARAAMADYAALADRMRQTRDAVAQEAHQAAGAAARAAASLVVGAEAAGIGESIADIRHQFALKAAEDVTIRERQLSWEESQIRRSMDKVAAGHQSRLNTRHLPEVPGVDWGGLLSSLTSVGASYASSTNRTA